jgi:hypothetical protein
MRRIFSLTYPFLAVAVRMPSVTCNLVRSLLEKKAHNLLTAIKLAAPPRPSLASISTAILSLSVSASEDASSPKSSDRVNYVCILLRSLRWTFNIFSAPF